MFPSIPFSLRLPSSSSSPFLRNCSLFFSSMAAGADTFVNIIESLFKEPSESTDQTAKLLEEFPYEITDDPGEMSVILKRRLISGENIQIVIHDRGNNYSAYSHILIDITIDKGEGHTLNVHGVLHANGRFASRIITVKRSVGTEAEAYEERMFGQDVSNALNQYFVVRGIDGYLYDFYQEYIVKKDKRVSAAGKFMMKRDKRACAAAKDMVNAADDELRRKLEFDAQVVEEIESANEVHELPEDFPFQIIESHGLALITLKRELPGESIQVDVFHDNRCSKCGTFRIHVMVNKEKGPTLRFSCKLKRDELKIKSMKKSDRAKGETHQWSDFSGLVRGLDMHRYLEIKGITKFLFDIFHGYLKKEKSQNFWQDVKIDFKWGKVDDPAERPSKSLEDHLMWLKSMREYLEK